MAAAGTGHRFSIVFHCFLMHIYLNGWRSFTEARILHQTSQAAGLPHNEIAAQVPTRKDVQTYLLLESTSVGIRSGLYVGGLYGEVHKSPGDFFLIQINFYFDAYGDIFFIRFYFF